MPVPVWPDPAEIRHGEISVFGPGLGGAGSQCQRPGKMQSSWLCSSFLLSLAQGQEKGCIFSQGSGHLWGWVGVYFVLLGPVPKQQCCFWGLHRAAQQRYNIVEIEDLLAQWLAQ